MICLHRFRKKNVKKIMIFGVKVELLHVGN